MESEALDITLLEKIEAQAIVFAGEAGRIVLEHFNKPIDVQFKGENGKDPVTTADRLSEEYLKSAISEKFPEHGILSEEGGALHESDSPFVWVLDPLDGTTNFMNGLPLFAVSIGVLWKGQPVVGSIFVPVSHRASRGVYHARLGNGAYLDDEKIELPAKATGRPLAGNPSIFRNRFRLGGRSSRQPHEARNLGSIALELALTAAGVFRYALFGWPKLWDVAAGVLLVQEAGGSRFIRQPKGRNWIHLERFQTEQVEGPESMEKLRKWSSPLVVGAPDITEKVVKDFRVPRAH